MDVDPYANLSPAARESFYLFDEARALAAALETPGLPRIVRDELEERLLRASRRWRRAVAEVEEEVHRGPAPTSR